MSLRLIVCAASVCFCMTATPSECTAETRQPWTESTIQGSPDPALPYGLERVYPDLRFQNPVQLRVVPGRQQMLMLQVNGKLFRFDDSADVEEAELVLDVGKGVPAIRAFGFGLHPDFANNGFLYLVYAREAFGDEHSARLSRFKMDLDLGEIDRESEQVLLTWPSGGHTGSTVEFDKKGYLYFSIGDGARPFPPDEFNVGQDLSDLRATICRIDVNRTDGDRPYGIPDDNPFVETPGARPEIWAYGFRNPWRFSIDQPTGRLLCGDVGWEVWESVFNVKRAGNYGWSRFEGPAKLRDDVPRGPTAIEPPLVAYSHAVGQSITGGFVYRGTDLPELNGAYLYGDYVSGLLWGLRHDESDVTWNPVLSQTGIRIITFSQSREGEILLVSYEGEVFRLVRNPDAGVESRFPRTLSATGLFESLRDLKPSPGVYEYRPTAVAEEGPVSKRFHLAIPGNGTIQIARQKRQWTYPPDTVFVRTYSRASSVGSEPLRLETQLLHFDGLTWQPYSYVWDADQADAVLIGSEAQTLTLPLVKDAAGEDDGSIDGGVASWRIPTRAQCRSCHTKQVGGAVGFSLEQLSTDQQERFIELGIIDRRSPANWQIRSMVPPDDSHADLNLRARSYLAANCAHCHCRGGGGSVALDLEYSKSDAQMGAIDQDPMQGGFGMKGAKVIKPGAPEHSVLLYRIATLGVGRMPKLSVHEADNEAVLLMNDWIRSMDPDRETLLDSEVSRDLNQLISLCRETDGESVRSTARQEIGRALERGDLIKQGMFERFLPRSERRNTLGPDVDPAVILKMAGDVDRGRQWLSGSGGAQCLACHRVAGMGRNVGPALDGIGGKRTREELLESLLNPSAKIDVQYQTVAVLTDEGKLVTGLLIDQAEGQENGDSLTIRSAEGKDHRVALDAVESRRSQSESLMPRGLVETMTASELADLLAYLSSLGREP